MTYKEFANYYKNIRISKNYTQKEFAFILGLNKTTYCRIENGFVEPDFNTLQLICRHLEIDLTKVLELKKPITSHIMFYD